MKPKSLTEYKEKQQVTIKQLAESLGISTVYVSFLLSGKRMPSRRLAARISSVTGIPVLNLLYPKAESHEQPSV